MILLILIWSTFAKCDPATGKNYLEAAQSFYAQGQFYRAARYAFAAQEEDQALESQAYSWAALGLIKAGLHQSAAYFYIRTLQSNNKFAIRRITQFAPEMLIRLGSDFLRPYLLAHTELSDYDERSKSVFLLSLAKESLLKGEEQKAIDFISNISSAPKSIMAPMYQMRATASALLGKISGAIADYAKCINVAENEDLLQRCRSGLARSYYENKQYDLADQTYDQISKWSTVWPEILFEQAWNAFAEKEYNRTLGKLVSYRSPALTYVYNPENDVLRAQTFLALCLYEDANKTVTEFNEKYGKLAETIKKTVELKSQDLSYFFNLGRQSLAHSIYNGQEFEHLVSRFVRSPGFKSQIDIERASLREEQAMNHFSERLAGGNNDPSQGFSGFLKKTLAWRKQASIKLGGGFVLNSLLDYHSDLLGQFDKMSFIKLEMLKRAKDRLIYKRTSQTEKLLENKPPRRKDYQYFWKFNGEFWNDEIGDYVFDISSACQSEEVL